MAKQIIGTNLEDLHEIFDISEEELSSKKARLFPIGNSENETSTVDIFLASLSGVKEYREYLFLQLGINKIKARNGNIHVYTEIQDGNKNNRPDGLVVITSGKTKPLIEWAGFIEAKIGDNQLESEQIERYIDFGKEIGITDIITISNALVTSPLDSPIKTRKKANLFHWSWTYLKVIASHLIKNDSIEDEDHVYILTELRRYMDSHRNLKNFINMGKSWKDNVATLSALREDDKIKKDILDEVVDALVQEEKDISLQLTDNSNYFVTLNNKKEDRSIEIANMLQNTKIVKSTYILDGNKKQSFDIEIDFIRQEIRCSTEITIENKKAQAQTTTLIKMFEKSAGNLENTYVYPLYPRRKLDENNTISLSELINEKEKGSTFYSCLDKTKGDTLKSFIVRTTTKLGKDFGGSKNFIVKLENNSEIFLDQVMSNIK
jgi:hypothetical protein